MKNKAIVIPGALTVYLAVMAYIGWPAYKSGEFSDLHYWGVIVGTLLAIVVLHFSIKRRERLRREREADLRSSEKARDNQEKQ